MSVCVVFERLQDPAFKVSPCCLGMAFPRAPGLRGRHFADTLSFEPAGIQYLPGFRDRVRASARWLAAVGTVVSFLLRVPLAVAVAESPLQLVVDLRACLSEGESDVWTLSALGLHTDVVGLKELVLFDVETYPFLRIEARWQVPAGHATIHILHRLVGRNRRCFGVRQDLPAELANQWSKGAGSLHARGVCVTSDACNRRAGAIAALSSGASSTQNPEAAAIAPKFGVEGTCLLVAAGEGLVVGECVPENLEWEVRVSPPCCEDAIWTDMVFKRLHAMGQRSSLHGCMRSFGPFDLSDVWWSFARVASGAVVAGSEYHFKAAYLMKQLLTYFRFRESDHPETEVLREAIGACPQIARLANRLNAVLLLVSALPLLSLSSGPQLLAHLRRVLRVNTFVDNAGHEAHRLSTRGYSPSWHDADDAFFEGLALNAEQLFLRASMYSEDAIRKPWNDCEATTLPAYCYDRPLTRLVSSSEESLPLHPVLLTRTDVLMSYPPLANDVGGFVWETSLYDLLSILPGAMPNEEWSWWATRGTLLGLLRYGHAVGQLSHHVDVVDDDLDIEIAVNGPEQMLELSLEISRKLFDHHHWAACYLGGSSLMSDCMDTRGFAAKVRVLNRGALKLSCQKIAYDQRFHLDVYFVFPRVRLRNGNPESAGPVPPMWARLILPIGPALGGADDVLVSNEACIDGTNYTGIAGVGDDTRFADCGDGAGCHAGEHLGEFGFGTGDIVRKDLVFPLSKCMLHSQFVEPGKIQEIPCPRDSSRFLLARLGRGPGTGQCLALPAVTRSRNLDDERNRQLAKGLTTGAIDEIRFAAGRLASWGYEAFVDKDFELCNVSASLTGGVYPTLACAPADDCRGLA